MWLVCWWCTACERCHEKYGTSSSVCSAYPACRSGHVCIGGEPWDEKAAPTEQMCQAAGQVRVRVGGAGPL
eukprot:scaffold54817_cov73-Phaeocystis_antarctica.AAC.3